MVRARLASSVALVVSALVIAACSAAGGDAVGGDLRFDASAPPANAGLGDAGAAACDLDADAGSGTTWNDLYRDYFGTTGHTSCAGNGTCHGDSTQAGAVAADYVCGHDADTCYAGITSSRAGLVTPGDTTTDPKKSGLYAVLRKACGGGGIMPKAPSYAFTAADMQRIAAWIGAGAAR